MERTEQSSGGLSVKKPLIISTIAGMLGMVWFTIAFGVPTSMLFEYLTGSGLMLGFFTTFTQCASLFQLPSVLLSELFESRKKYWGAFSMTNRILWFSPILVILLFRDNPHTGALILIALLALASACGHSASPVWLDWMADLIPESISERYWGIRQSVTSAVFFITTAISGYILDKFAGSESTYKGFLLAFLIGAIAGVFDILLHLQVPDFKSAKIANKNGNQFSIQEKIFAPMQDRDFRFMTLAYAAWFFGMFVIGPFGLVYLKREFGATYTELSFIAAVPSISAALFGIINGIIIDKISARTYFCIAMALCPIFWLVWFFAGNQVMLIDLGLFRFEVKEYILFIGLASFVAGILASGIGICQFHLANILAEKAWRRIGIAEHWGLIGIISAIGPFIGGAITDFLSDKTFAILLPSGKYLSYIHIQILIAIFISWFFAIPLMLKVEPEKGAISIGRTVFMIYLYPLRGIGVLYNAIGSIIFSTNKDNGDKR